MTQKPITIKDIAEKLNISVSTVSRALKDNHEISAQTRKTVQELAKQLGYKPNPIAVALKTHKSHSIGVIVPQIVSTFFATVVKTIEEVADGHGYNVLVISSNESFQKEQKSESKSENYGKSKTEEDNTKADTNKTKKSDCYLLHAW